MPPIRQHRSKNDPEYESRLQNALEDLHTRACSSIAEASRKHNVSRTTLGDRFHGKHSNVNDAYSCRRLLTDMQERVLTDWMDTLATQGMPLDQQSLRRHAYEISGKMPGQNWAFRFIARHQEFISARACGLDPARGKNFNKSTIQDYFDKLYEVLKVKYGEIPTSQIWNMDEKGIQLGGGRKDGSRRFYFRRNRKIRYRIRSDNLELVTVIECVSAAGYKAPTTFILKNGPTPDIRGVKDVGGLGFSESGWTDREQTADWIKKVFIPHAKSTMTDHTKPIVLLIDGHDSHECLDIKRAVYQNQGTTPIIVMAFPSKCTHKLQPLDVGIFNHTQRAWKKRCDELVALNKTMSRYTVVQEYMEIQSDFLTPQLIRSSFRNTGISPFNSTIFTDEDFAPSQTFSTRAHVPKSYPGEVPSSDLAIPSDAEEDNNDDNDDDDDDDSDFSISNQGNTVTTTESRDENSDLADRAYSLQLPSTPSTSSHANNRSERLTRSASQKHLTIMEDIQPAKTESSLRSMTKGDLIAYALQLQRQMHALTESLNMTKAWGASAEAHCTVAQLKLSHTQERLVNANAKKQRGSTKVTSKARFVIMPELEAAFEQEEKEATQRENERQIAEETKRTEAANRNHRIFLAASSRVFQPLKTYRLKEDLVILARALKVSEDGTNQELTNRIQQHITDNEAVLITDARFSGLYHNSRQSRRLAQEPISTNTLELDNHAQIPTNHYNHYPQFPIPSYSHSALYHPYNDSTYSYSNYTS